MMSKVYNLCFSVLQKVMFVIALDWFIVSILYLWELEAWAVPVSILFLGIAFLFRKRLERLYAFLMNRKIAVMFVVILIQILFLFSAELLIRRDAAVVFTGAFRQLKESSISSYLTRNPNNMFLFLYERFFYRLFGDSALWILQALNLVTVNLGAWVLYKGSKRHFSQEVADTVFSLYVLLACLSPYFYSMYTDMLPLPLIAWQIFLILDLLKTDTQKTWIQTSILLGLVTSLVVLIRPPGAILLIAFFMLLFLKGSFRKAGLIFVTFLLTFGLGFGTGNYLVKHQQEVPIVQGEGLSKGPLLFINLGLTYIGHDQEDMKAGLLQYVEPEKQALYNNGMFKTEYIIKEIKRRLGDYTPFSFLDHLNYKHSLTVREGTLGWLYRDAKNEKTPFINPLYPYTKNFSFANWIRTYFLSTDKAEYRYYAIVKQVIWIIMSLGLILAVRKYQADDVHNLLMLAIFGGLAFLLIFEGGKTRYLIQFLPQILLLSSLGLSQLKKIGKK